MRVKFITVLIALATACGSALAEPKPTPYILIEGQATDSGLGACILQSPITAIFIKGMNEWIPGLAGTGSASKYVIIGKLEESFDLPTTSNPAEARKKVFVPEGMDAHQASHRWNITTVEHMYQADPLGHPLRDHRQVKLDWNDDFSVPSVPNQDRFFCELKVPYKIGQGALNSAVDRLNKGGFEKVLIKFTGDNFTDQ
jgi:hypothetical protein